MRGIHRVNYLHGRYKILSANYRDDIYTVIRKLYGVFSLITITGLGITSFIRDRPTGLPQSVIPQFIHSMKLKILLLLLCSSHFLFAQQKNLSGKIIDSVTRSPVNGVTVILTPGTRVDITDENGNFYFKNTGIAKMIAITAIGYKKMSINVSDFPKGRVIAISQQQTELADVVISGNAPNPYKTISETDIKLRAVSNSQEVL
ncbi:MAG: TonB-dependent receptor, partial [Mucilaginibacter sp.]|nr:TonB-dependent receptor [Mucilaginibacter sp.]